MCTEKLRTCGARYQEPSASAAFTEQDDLLAPDVIRLAAAYARDMGATSTSPLGRSGLSTGGKETEATLGAHARKATAHGRLRSLERR